MEIRPFQPADENAVITLWQKTSMLPWNNEATSREHIHDKLATQPELFLVGVSEQQIIATAMADYSADTQEAFMRYVAVSPKHRRHGHARAIINALEELLRQQGCQAIRLCVSATRFPAIQCYSRLDYVAQDVTMVKKLPTHTPEK